MKLHNLYERKRLTHDELEASYENDLVIKITEPASFNRIYIIKDVPPTITDVQFAKLLKTSFEPGSIPYIVFS